MGRTERNWSSSKGEAGGRAEFERGASVEQSRLSIGLRDVARAAGVSTATVSRAINRPDIVSDELRTRISAVIDHLGWVPDGAARALATRRSGAVGAVFPTLSHGDFARAATALQRELLAENYILLLACSEYDPAQELRQVRKFLERGVDGMILVGHAHHADLPGLLRRQRIPSINTFVFNRDDPTSSIGPDNHKALAELTEYLVKLGHIRFGVIGQSTTNNDRAAARLAGIRDALGRHGLAVRPMHWGEGLELSSVTEARAIFRRIMKASPRPTAILCANAYLAVGAELEALAMGLAVPGDVSIVGYDDTEVMSELPVPITTVRVPGDEVGRRAARYILAQIFRRVHETVFECDAQIIVRASSGPPPRRAK
ncbi:MAG: LacI family DNA-binding transcriptional regulator [Hyphomicrobiales bacterium]|nr:LacI family DNA-binding transcriptional regulator [Hyphomicrobiales bacterium]